MWAHVCTQFCYNAREGLIIPKEIQCLTSANFDITWYNHEEVFMQLRFYCSFFFANKHKTLSTALQHYEKRTWLQLHFFRSQTPTVLLKFYPKIFDCEQIWGVSISRNAWVLMALGGARSFWHRHSSKLIATQSQSNLLLTTNIWMHDALKKNVLTFVQCAFLKACPINIVCACDSISMQFH